MKKFILGIMLVCIAAKAHAFGASPILNLQEARPFLIAQAPAGSPPPTAPPQLLQTVAKAAGYIPSSWDLTIGHFSIGISTDIGDFYTVGARDWYNGQWLSGWGKEIAPMKWNGREVAFIAAQNVFNSDEGGKGAIGGSIGFRPVNLINSIGTAANMANDVIPLPPWAQTLNNYMSIEVGYAYRLQNTPGVYRSVATLGGQVRLPLDLIHGL